MTRRRSVKDIRMLGSTLARRQLLRSSPFFSRLGDSEADAILAQATVARYAEGALIFAKGDPGNSMMAVLRGRVMISSPSVDGRQVVLTTFREGDVFGEIALLDGKERTADATAATDCELLVVARRSHLGGRKKSSRANFFTQRVNAFTRDCHQPLRIFGRFAGGNGHVREIRNHRRTEGTAPRARPRPV